MLVVVVSVSHCLNVSSGDCDEEITAISPFDSTIPGTKPLCKNPGEIFFLQKEIYLDGGDKTYTMVKVINFP